MDKDRIADRLDQLYSLLFDYCSNEEFDVADKVIDGVKNDEVAILVGVLTITYHWRDQLSNRKTIIDIIERDYPDRAERLLKYRR